ncbi:hypothetical protein ACFO1B_10895 [Dactylosporangium siamense]|uniref:Uncharacterized protein n=1 Tax=Dactylosporangium siamense TaxID=685454 RepID=A0A919UAB5_9ACTN|nr:hypothetical protein [Dactylosporangium siamense]GIG44306.1 hypothetical protein Dsi01nite_023470 [Dactylosporangium siamense]
MAAQRTIAQRAIRQESEVLLRQLDAYLTALRTGRDAASRTGRDAAPQVGRDAAPRTGPGVADVGHAERMAAALRQLIADTARSSAVDRAKVRAAVHYFVYRGAAGATGTTGTTGDGPARPGGARLALLTGGRAPAERRRHGDDDRVVNDLLRDLGRADLIVEH